MDDWDLPRRFADEGSQEAFKGVLPAGHGIAMIAKGAGKMMTWVKVKLITSVVSGGAGAIGETGALIAGMDKTGQPAAPGAQGAAPGAQGAAPGAPGAAPGQAVAPTTPPPASKPAAGPPDFTSPMAALNTNKQAMASGDAALMKRC